MRLSRVIRLQQSADGEESVPLRRALLWTLAGVAIALAVALYFRYARLLAPILG